MICPGDTNAVFFSSLFPGRYPRVMSRLESVLNRHGIPFGFIEGTRDIWARDFMAVQVDEGAFVQFTYAPDYLKDEPAIRTNRDEWRIDPALRARGTWKNTRLVIDGGNIVVGPGNVAVMTDKVYRENPGWDRDRLKEKLKRLLRVKKLMILPREPYDPIGHSDGMVWFWDENRVLVNDSRKLFPAYRDRLIRRLCVEGLEYEEIPYTPPRGRGMSALGNYVNILQVGNVIILPAYGRKDDRIAVDQVRRVTGGRCHVHGIRCEELAAEGGCWNCVSWSIRCDPMPSVLRTEETRGIRPGTPKQSTRGSR